MVSVCATLDSIGKLVELDPIGLDLMLVIAAPLNRSSESSQERWGFVVSGSLKSLCWVVGTRLVKPLPMGTPYRARMS